MSFGAKINLELKQLIFPIKLSMAGKCIGLKIITPNNLKKLEESEGTTFNEQNLPKHYPWLFGYQFARNQENVVITATAADALVIMQNFSVPALCLPSKNSMEQKFSLSVKSLSYLIFYSFSIPRMFTVLQCLDFFCIEFIINSQNILKFHRFPNITDF